VYLERTRNVILFLLDQSWFSAGLARGSDGIFSQLADISMKLEKASIGWRLHERLRVFPIGIFLRIAVKITRRGPMWRFLSILMRSECRLAS
jgi:hypothetical protein